MEIKTKKTIESVVKDGLCTGCGTCVGVCPSDALEMAIENYKGIYLPYLNKEKCNECSLCFQVCPGHAVDFKQLNLDIFGKEPDDAILGNYLNCYTGHATDYDIRYNSASGGLVTALLIFALEKGLINGALVTRMREDRPLEPLPFIARTKEEIISASKSKYCPVPANVALKEILIAKEGEKFAVVELPCHIHGVRKAMRVNHKLREKIVLNFGILCSHAASFQATEYMLNKLKVRKEEVERLDYRGDGWPGKMRISLKDRSVSLKYPDYYGKYIALSFFCQRRCLLCYDQGNELADISFGDPWGLEKDNVGKSLIISRSSTGEKLLQKATYENNIKIMTVDREKVQGVGFRTGAIAHLNFRKLFGKAIPLYHREAPKLSPKTYLRSALSGLLLYLGSKRFLWPFLRRALTLYDALNVLRSKIRK